MTQSSDAISAFYQVNNWGAGYFQVNDDAQMSVSPTANGPLVPLTDILSQAKADGLTLPVLLRFPQILASVAQRHWQAFESARQAVGYEGRYQPLYPIKVNQQREVVEALFNADTVPMGLEAGSKPELMAVLSIASKRAATLVCNGYKDAEFIRLALIGQAMGHSVYLIIERLSEIDLIASQAAQLGVRPNLGIRVRLNNVGSGNWQNTGGPKSKFGLSAASLVTALARLKHHGLTDCVSLLHFHMGSQITHIDDIRTATAEGAAYWQQLVGAGLPIDTVDVGGGLGVDYEGTASRQTFSKNYSLTEYAATVLDVFKTASQSLAVPAPHIFTESGRALAAHHAVLCTDIIDVEPSIPDDVTVDTNNAAVKKIHELSQKLNQGLAVDEALAQAADCASRIDNAFVSGTASLEEKASVQLAMTALMQACQSRLDHTKPRHQQLAAELNERLADKYFCNFSVFQSLPDIWAIDQIFPIVPLAPMSKLGTARAILQDMTCDSDGKIAKYVDAHGLDSSLPTIPWSESNRYALGVFLVGAYQEILGDCHNLFGDTDVVSVHVDETGTIALSKHTPGESVADVLASVGYDHKAILQQYKQRMSVIDGCVDEKARYLDMLAAGLAGYTYLERNE